jgi:hypothetical protein
MSFFLIMTFLSCELGKQEHLEYSGKRNRCRAPAVLYSAFVHGPEIELAKDTSFIYYLYNKALFSHKLVGIMFLILID